MRILHTVSGLWKHTGGPAEAIPLLCQNLLANGNEVSIVTLDGELSDAALACRKAGVGIHTFSVSVKGRPWYSRKVRKGIRVLLQTSDIIHGNGLWEYTNWCTGSEALRHDKPFIVSFHGSAMKPRTNWALRHKLMWKLMDGRYVKKATCLHACTEDELKSIREIGLKNPVAVIPNGVEIWPDMSQDRVRQLLPEFYGKKTLLFLSRIHPSKGIYDLVNAWYSIDKIPDQWQLVIAGLGRPEHIEELKRLIRLETNRDSIIYMGPLFNDMRIAAYQACDVFVCPSYTENFGIVTGEALANKKPVIATYGVPWPDLIKYQCGWRVSNSINDLKGAISQAINMSDDNRKVMGQRGRELIEKKYTWPHVTGKMFKTYEWILGGGQIPSWVDCI
jgi:glycosyltransferase involved in cell wall biosynthesis